MEVQNVNNKSSNVISQIVFPALAGGVLAQACHELTLPVETKAALKNSRLSQDKFVKKAVDFAEKSLKNIQATREAENAAKKVLGSTIVSFDNVKTNIEKVAENAKEMYPKIQETAKIAKKSLNKTLIGTIALIAVVKIASMIFFNKQKNNKQIQGQTIKSTTA